jgi:antibiotic biosynthesis monooxygenase (ABM) superfamily enzyme
MPQFDFFSFVTQTFWVLFGLVIFYFLITYFFVPKYSEVLKFREKLEFFLLKNSVETKSLYDIYIKKFFEKLR